jgi:hypothetical protein
MKKEEGKKEEVKAVTPKAKASSSANVDGIKKKTCEFCGHLYPGWSDDEVMNHLVHKCLYLI